MERECGWRTKNWVKIKIKRLNFKDWILLWTFVTFHLQKVLKTLFFFFFKTKISDFIGFSLATSVYTPGFVFFFFFFLDKRSSKRGKYLNSKLFSLFVMWESNQNHQDFEKNIIDIFMFGLTY